jgi:hypothetical protein
MKTLQQSSYCLGQFLQSRTLSCLRREQHTAKFESTILTALIYCWWLTSLHPPSSSCKTFANWYFILVYLHTAFDWAPVMGPHSLFGILWWWLVLMDPQNPSDFRSQSPLWIALVSNQFLIDCDKWILFRSQLCYWLCSLEIEWGSVTVRGIQHNHLLFAYVIQLIPGFV